jgi:hypothetical protein
MSDERGLVKGALSRLRHPWLFGIAAVMLAADLVVPDIVPFVDEVLLAAATTGFAMLKKRRSTARDEAAEGDAAAVAGGPAA